LWIFLLIGRKRRRVEPHAYVVVLKVLRVLKVLEGSKTRKINAIEGERPPFMGCKAPTYGVKGPRLWGERPPFMGKAPVYGDIEK
jgi:hypothetical protein